MSMFTADPTVQANAPATLTPTVDAGATAGASWGDILKGVVGNKAFMPMLMMAGMMAANRKKGRGGGGMNPMLLAMVMPELFKGKGTTASPTAPAPLPAAAPPA